MKQSIKRKKGFTLLEVLLAIMILAALAGVIFGLGRSSLQLSNAVVEKQRETMNQMAYLEHMKTAFSELPGNAIIDLQTEASIGNGPLLSELTFQNVPLVFDWGEQARGVKTIVFKTVVRRDGLIDVVMKYYDEELLDDSQAEQIDRDETNERAKAFFEVVMLEGVRWFEWQVFDSRSGDWVRTWDNRGRQPNLIQLDYAVGGSEDNVRQIYWIPPKENPAALMRQLQQNGGANSSGGENPRLPDSPGGGISVPVPPIQ